MSGESQVEAQWGQGGLEKPAKIETNSRETQKIIKEQKPYTTKELFKKQCPFTTAKLECPFWRNVTKYETVDKVVAEENKFVACCEGYFLKNNESCLPLCKDQCINGNCTAPDECTCWEGYNKSPDKTNICNPFCTSCVNGDCIEPNKCRCHKGYVEDPETHICEPFCGDDKCGFGHCQESYNCKCDAGYEKDGNGTCTIKSCVSKCNGGNCIDGNCECPIGAEWSDELLSCVCPTLPTTLQAQTQKETSTIPNTIPSTIASTITEENTRTETVESPSDDSGYDKDLLIKGLSGIIY
uniref:EGF-like domain-containing protein n=1 Tax=Phlebotomus papatasi TaxID=29031 RepID=A0A1B0DAJ0_PHLPP